MSSDDGEGACTECLGRIPYASLLALAFCWVGVGVFCSMMYSGFNTSIRQTQDIFNMDLPWLDKVQLTFIVIAAVMGFAALILLVIGALATGETRNTVYSGWTARLGGRISCALFLGVAYLLNLCWLGVFGFTSILAFLYYMFERLCARYGDEGISSADCIDFSMISAFFNGTSASPDTNSVCGQHLREFCSLTRTALPWYAEAVFGSALVVLGLTHFMICLAANYAHIKDEIKYFELQEIHKGAIDFMPMDERKPNRR